MISFEFANVESLFFKKKVSMNQIFYLKEGYITPVNLLTTMSEGGGSSIIKKNKFHGSHFSEKLTFTSKGFVRGHQLHC